MPSLYRRHRPRTFDDVVGQEHIVRTLRNAIELGKVHHAYLFVGSRGTGKTSMAKLLACALNCEGGPRADFSPDDPACEAIAAGRSMDVVEMDAASNNSVDDIRELRENVALAPMSGNRRVYILDEAHMLSQSAWNAFLKTLEEPPAHVVFVLATTEPHKVPATIVDRCHRFDFQRPSIEQIEEVLRRVAAEEGIEVPPAALAAIARAATGSFRDALGTLEQLVTYGGREVRFSDVQEVLGIADPELVLEAGEALAGRDPRAALMVVEHLASSGRDPSQFMRDLAEHLRRLYVLQAMGEAPAGLPVTEEHAERLSAQADRLSQPEVLRALDLLGEAVSAVKDGSDPRIRLELALLKAVQPPADLSLQALAQRIEALERGAPRPASNPDGGGGARAARSGGAAAARGEAGAAQRGAVADAGEARTADTRADDPAAPPDAAPGASAPGADAGAPEAGGPDLDLERLQSLWPAVVDAVRNENAMVGALLGEARATALEAGRLVVDFPPDREFLKKKAEASRGLLLGALRNLAGQAPGLEFRLNGEVASRAGTLSEEELLRRLKEEFGATETPIAEEPAARGET